MSFAEVRLSDQIAEGASGGPQFRTVVVTTSNGAEQRIGYWSRARLKWDISYGPNDPLTMAALISFFRAMHGKLIGFRFRDWTDYIATGEALVNQGTVTLQLQKTYAISGQQEVRYIVKPVSGTVTIYKNGPALVAGTDYVLDYATGIVTLTTSAVSGDVFAWSGQFDVPVRFDTDEMRHENSSVGERNWESVPVIELTADQFIAASVPPSGGGGGGSPPAVTAGNVTVTKNLPGTKATVSATGATGGTAPFTYQWYRSVGGGIYVPYGGPQAGLGAGIAPTGFVDNILNGVVYGYEYVVVDSLSQTATTAAVTVTGGP